MLCEMWGRCFMTTRETCGEQRANLLTKRGFSNLNTTRWLFYGIGQPWHTAGYSSLPELSKDGCFVESICHSFIYIRRYPSFFVVRSMDRRGDVLRLRVVKFVDFITFSCAGAVNGGSSLMTVCLRSVGFGDRYGDKLIRLGRWDDTNWFYCTHGDQTTEEAIPKFETLN